MTLIEAVKRLAEFDDDCTIYARSPWGSSTEATLAVEGSEEEKKAKTEGLRYFLRPNDVICVQTTSGLDS